MLQKHDKQMHARQRTRYIQVRPALNGSLHTNYANT